MNKPRSRGDLRQNMVNMRTSFITPITLPTWGQIAQLSNDAYRANTKWAFLKADRDSSYKQLPLRTDFAGITVVALRGPATSKWHAFFPRVLLFEAVSALIHYNCLARPLAVLINRTLGIPVLIYFDDFGALEPESLGTMALWMVENTTPTLCAPMKSTKSLVGAHHTFLGLLGSFLVPQKGLILSIELPQGKIAKWPHIIRDRIADGRITSKHLEKLIGKLSFAQTSVFGRFGRSLLIPLRDKLSERPYSEILPTMEIDILLWRGHAITSHVARSIEIKHKVPEYAIYSDASTSTKIAGALVRKNETPSDRPIIDELREAFPPLVKYLRRSNLYMRARNARHRRNYPCLRWKLRDKTVVFYIDNSNCRGALARDYAATKAIDSLVQIFGSKSIGSVFLRGSN